MAQKPFETAVLNLLLGAANTDLTGGKFTVLDNAGVELLTRIRTTDGTSFSKAAYSAGVASEKDYDLTGISLLANSQYRLTVAIDGRVDFSSGGGKETNALFITREYVVSTGTSVPTADDIKDLFIERINLDQFAGVTASSGGVGILTLVLDSVSFGDFEVEAPVGAVEAIIVAYVAPSGTPSIVEALAPTKSSPTANYTTWKISYDRPFRSGAVSGSIVKQPEFVYIFADALAANYAAFETALDDILDGSHLPVADYLGI